MPYTRRQFLRRAAAAAAIAASPTLVPGNAFGIGDKPAPSNRVTLGYLGVGPRGLLNCREALGCAEAQVLAVCDVWDYVLQRAKQTVDGHYGNQDCRAYVDFREVLARDDIDAVSIATPDHWHVPMAVLAAEAGKDISLEKPMGVAFAEDQACRAAVRRYNRVFQYGTEARARAGCRLACELIRNGRMGELREIRVKAPDSVPGGSRAPRPVPDGLHYDLWLGPAPWRPYSGSPDNGPGWYHVYDYALGFIAGWGAHPLDLLVWAYDAHEHGPWEVEGTGRINPADRNDAVYNWDVRIRLANGVTISYWGTGVPKDEDPRLAKLNNYAQFIGSEGWIAPYYDHMLCEPESLAETTLGTDAIRLPHAAGQERNFIECVLSRQTPVAPIDDAVHSDMISHVADIAIRCGRKIVWDPAREEIVGDPQASRGLTRAYRAPWSRVMT